MTIKKRVWTVSDAKSWVSMVEAGKVPRGLKYCSAVSYLNGLKGKGE